MKKKVNDVRCYALQHGDVFTITAKAYYESEIIKNNSDLFHILSIEVKQRYIRLWKIKIPWGKNTDITIRYDGDDVSDWGWNK